MCYRNRTAFCAAVFLAISLIVFSACRRQASEPVASTPTPTALPAIDEARIAPYDPRNPYRQYAPGLLARTVYKSEPAERFVVEMWDLLVGPGKKSESAVLPGGAVFEIRSGSGIVTVGEQRHEVKVGATFSVDEGNSFQIENSADDDSLSIRVVLIHSPRN